MDIKARLRNKTFLLACISFIILCVKTFTRYQFPDNLDLLVNMFLSLLVGLGVVIDPTTPGIADGQPVQEVDTTKIQ